MCYGRVSAAWRVWEDRYSYLAVFLLHNLPVVALPDSTVFFQRGISATSLLCSLRKTGRTAF